MKFQLLAAAALASSVIGQVINIPEINISVPSVTIPDINISIPSVTIPSISIPSITIPSITVPNFNVVIPTISVQPNGVSVVIDEGVTFAYGDGTIVLPSGSIALPGTIIVIANGQTSTSVRSNAATTTGTAPKATVTSTSGGICIGYCSAGAENAKPVLGLCAAVAVLVALI